MKSSKRIQFFFRDLKAVLQTKIGIRCFVLSIFFLALNVVLPVWRIVPLRATQPYIPLHYNIYLGVDQFGSWQRILSIPFLGLALFLFHLFLQTIAFRTDKFLASVLWVVMVMIQFILLCAMALIVLLNLSYAA